MQMKIKIMQHKALTRSSMVELAAHNGAVAGSIPVGSTKQGGQSFGAATDERLTMLTLSSGQRLGGPTSDRAPPQTAWAV